MLEIAKRTLDLTNLENKFLNEVNTEENIIYINNEEDIKDLIKEMLF